MEHGNAPEKPPVRRRYHPHEDTVAASSPIPANDQQNDIQQEVAPQHKEIPQNNIPQYHRDEYQARSFQYPSQYSSQVSGDFHQPNKPNTPEQAKRKMVFFLGIALCSIVLVVSASMLIRYYSQIYRANSATNQFRELYNVQASTAETENPVLAATSVQTEAPTSAPTETPAPAITSAPVITPGPEINSASEFLAQWPSHYPGNEQLRIQEKFTPLRRQNRDVVGWLSIEGVVDEPVFQRDNSYYLTHDATGAKNPTGALFLDENCNLRTVPMQVLIHGHNMKEGAMFGSLKKYKVKDASFYREHPFIQFDSLYESATYVIFAVAEVNIVAGNTHYFPFWHKFRFDDSESFRQYVSLAKEYSRFKVDIDVQPGDRLLTLATCSSGDDNLRLIIMARMVREDEDTIMLTNKIYSATAK